MNILGIVTPRVQNSNLIMKASRSCRYLRVVVLQLRVRVRGSII